MRPEGKPPTSSSSLYGPWRCGTMAEQTKSFSVRFAERKWTTKVTVMTSSSSISTLTWNRDCPLCRLRLLWNPIGTVCVASGGDKQGRPVAQGRFRSVVRVPGVPVGSRLFAVPVVITESSTLCAARFVAFLCVGSVPERLDQGRASIDVSDVSSAIVDLCYAGISSNWYRRRRSPRSLEWTQTSTRSLSLTSCNLTTLSVRTTSISGNLICDPRRTRSVYTLLHACLPTVASQTASRTLRGLLV
jgi:hypothetical protein